MGKTIKQLKEYATKKFIENNLQDQWIDINIILGFTLNMSTTSLIIYDQKDIEDELIEKFYQYIDMRINNAPVAYIVGYKYFMGYKFWVNNNVLIPRSDTELLVENAIKLIKSMNQEKINLVDMCTGSGCIAISVLKYFKDHDIVKYNRLHVICVDISKDALEVAMYNSKSHMVQSKIEFIESDLFNNMPSRKIDVLISNPPYIRTEIIETLDESVKLEPIIALDGKQDGLFFYKEISNNVKMYLNNDAYVLYEIGYDQAAEVVNILKENGYSDIKVVKDLSEHDRVVICKNG